MEFYGNQDYKQSQLIEFVPQKGTSFPAANQGQLFYRTDLHKLYVRSVSSWTDLTATVTTSAVLRTNCLVTMFDLNPGNVNTLDNKTKVKVTSGGFSVNGEWVFNSASLTLDITVPANWLSGSAPSFPSMVYVYGAKSGTNFIAMLDVTPPNLNGCFYTYGPVTYRCLGSFLVEANVAYTGPGSVTGPDYGETRIYPFLRQGNYVHFVGPYHKRCDVPCSVDATATWTTASITNRALPRTSNLAQMAINADVASSSWDEAFLRPKGSNFGASSQRAEAFKQSGVTGNQDAQHGLIKMPFPNAPAYAGQIELNVVTTGTGAQDYPMVLGYWETF